ncbi:hypothetical protein BDL97_17G068000 [Sphagnum fallax]|uniref:Uncharacterized protein n=2 Tax=Sphagnum jensenii TaxID=128206 RepID=A0ABP0WEH2_9BRYO|nr:hypothetical protein BDL97_17G068000 [Sphagnum fallax]
MAALISTCSCASATACFVQKSFPSCSSRPALVAGPVVGLPVLHMQRRVVCSAERKADVEKSEATSYNKGFPQLVAAMSTASALTAAHPALALVDERLSTEGTGLGLGLSNSKLTWILVGVTTLIWVLYFIYSTGLPEGDDDSGLSL